MIRRPGNTVSRSVNLPWVASPSVQCKSRYQIWIPFKRRRKMVFTSKEIGCIQGIRIGYQDLQYKSGIIALVSTDDTQLYIFYRPPHLPSVLGISKTKQVFFTGPKTPEHKPIEYKYSLQMYYCYSFLNSCVIFLL